MGKKIKEEKKVVSEEAALQKDGIKTIGIMTPHDYWEWRTTVTEVDLETEKNASTELRFLSMQKDIELAQLKRQLFLSTVFRQQKEQLEKIKQESETWRKSLEERLGINLKGCIIDDVTFEIKQLEET